MRLGDLLLQQRLITRDQLRAALEAQGAEGGRLGTNLVKLGFLEVDTLAGMLGDQHGVNAAQRAHGATVDRRLMALFSARSVKTYKAMPLGYSASNPPRAIIACADPGTVPVDELAFAAGCRVEVWVAPELLIQDWHEQYFGILRASRGLDTLEGPSSAPATRRMKSPLFPDNGPASTRDSTRPKPAAGLAEASPASVPPPPASSRVVIVAAPPSTRLQVPAAPPSAPPASAAPAPAATASAAPAPTVSLPPRRSSDLPPPDSGWDVPSNRAPAVAEVAPSAQEVAARVAPLPTLPEADPFPAAAASAPPAPLSAPPSGPGETPVVPVVVQSTLDVPIAPMVGKVPAAPQFAPPRPTLDQAEASRRMESATSKEHVGQVLADWLHATFGCGLVFVVKNDMATGWKGFFPDASDLVEAVVVPLGKPSVLSTAFELRTAFCGPPKDDGLRVNQLLWRLLRCEPPSEVLVCPVVLGNRAVNLLYAQSLDGAALSDSQLRQTQVVCADAAAAYGRLIRKKDRAKSA